MFEYEKKRCKLDQEKTNMLFYQSQNSILAYLKCDVILQG